MDMRRLINLVENQASVMPTKSVLDDPNFRTWFAGSKIVDKNGNPIRCYHGTIGDFSSFDGERSNSKTKTGVPQGVFFFSTNPDVAASYAGQKTHAYGIDDPDLERQYQELINKGSKEHVDFFVKHAVPDVKRYASGSNIMPVYLRVKKPLRVNANGDNWRNIYYKGDEWSTNDLVRLAQSKGYDGLIITNVFDIGEGKGIKSTVIAVFSPSQIKSVFNKGSYNPNSHDVTESTDEEEYRDIASAYMDKLDHLLSGGHVSVTCHQVDSNTVELHYIEAQFPGRGHGRKALEKAVALADQLGVRLTLEVADDEDDYDGGGDDDADDYEEPGKERGLMGANDLIGWYSRFGFEITGHDGWRMQMAREPKTK